MPTTNRPRVFIGSSSEQIELARAVQENLERDFETKVWEQEVFELSQYPLESLINELNQMDFGIFVLAPDDLVIMRQEQYLVPRDNVIFELGIYTGKLGRARTFICAPRGEKKLHLPTDLLGLTIADYEPARHDQSYVAALGAACTKIRRLIKKQAIVGLLRQKPIVQSGFFGDFDPTFNKLLHEAKIITLYFIHSRRWRENNHHLLKEFLDKPDSRLTVLLPDLRNDTLIQSLVTHFDDGPYVSGFIADAYRYFTALSQTYKNKISLRLFTLYPTYTVYKFDETMIIALYPTTATRKPVPTFEFLASSVFGKFVQDDLEILEKESHQLELAEMVELAKMFAK